MKEGGTGEGRMWMRRKDTGSNISTNNEGITGGYGDKRKNNSVIFSVKWLGETGDLAKRSKIKWELLKNK